MNTLEKLLDIVHTSKFVDLTHTIEEGLPHWPTQPGVTIETGTRYTDDGSYWRTITMCEHSGTHIDASSHFFENAENVDEIPIERLIGRGVNIDVTYIGPNGTVTADDIKKFEKENGNIQPGDIVFFRFAWDDKWKTGEDSKAFMEDWPGTSKEAAEYLLSKKVAAVCTDASALDVLNSGNPSHVVLLGHGINIIENVDNLDKLPAFFGVIGMPCKIKDGSGSTMRLVALVDK